MFSHLSVLIRSNRRSGAILIITPDHGYVYLFVPEVVFENLSVRKFKGSEVLPL